MPQCCETCKTAYKLNVIGDYICPNHGVVKNDHVCKKYERNELRSKVVEPNEPLYKQYENNDAAVINEKENQKMNRIFTPLGKITAILLMLVCVYAIWEFTLRGSQWQFLGGMMFVFMVIKQIFALCYSPCKKELTKDYKVSAILTCYNENPESVVSILNNILALDYPVCEILFLDDGSKDTLAYEVAKSFAETHKNILNAPEFKIIRFEENRGKRELMVDGFKLASGDYVFMLDSDSVIMPNALTELLRPFEKKKTTSVVGSIGVANRKRSFIGMMQSITYFGAFQMGRAAQSVTGDVVVCSGAFSIHKKDFILENLEEFKESEPFGIKVSAGDDRSLTTLSKLSGGKTRYQCTAYCETETPQKWKKFQSQRRRWQRSGYVCCLDSIKQMFPRNLLYLFWAFTEVYLWLIATIIFIIQITTRGFQPNWMDIILYFIIISYMHNAFYALYRPIRYLLVPFYLLVYGFSLTYTRIHAAVTIGDDDWGTRTVVDEEQAPVEEVALHKSVA